MFDLGTRRGEFTTAVSPAEAGRILCDLYISALRRWATVPQQRDETLADDLATALAVMVRDLAMPGHRSR